MKGSDTRMKFSSLILITGLFLAQQTHAVDVSTAKILMLHSKATNPYSWTLMDEAVLQQLIKFEQEDRDRELLKKLREQKPHKPSRAR